MKFYSRLFLALAWAMAIFLVITMPAPIRERVVNRTTYYDKAIHLFMFFGLSFLLALAGKELKKIRYLYIIIPSALIAIAFDWFSEFIQLYVPGRHSSEQDFLAGVLGALLGITAAYFLFNNRKPKLLLHICCIGCGVSVAQELREKYDVTLYFYNPNIYPLMEYERRLEEIKKVARKYRFRIIIDGYDHTSWLRMIQGYEREPERGARCLICYRDRLIRTAKMAMKLRHQYFTSTLTVSPHKDTETIFRIGREVEARFGVDPKGQRRVIFLAEDFKKNDGFKRSCAMSKELNLYRQTYCGCEFSMR